MTHATGARRAVASALAIGSVVLGLTAPAAAQDKSKRDAAISIFSAQKCTLCHSIAGKGNQKGAVDDVGGKLKPEEIRQWIVDPDAMRLKAHATRTPPMKKTTLNKDQLEALVGYLQTLKSSSGNAASK